MPRSLTLKPLAAGLALFGIVAGAGLAQAQARDPAYAAARAAGQVGEKMDGYLAVVGGVALRDGPDLEHDAGHYFFSFSHPG